MKTDEVELTVEDIDEIVDELEKEIRISPLLDDRPACKSFWKNIRKSLTGVPKGESMRYRFQKLAGIIGDKAVASLFINGQRVELTELPRWYDVIRFKLCGFKYETYD